MKCLHRIATAAVLVALLLVLSAGTALAEDLNPPAWRGLPGTTLQLWEFDNADPNPVPDILDNPYGMPVAVVSPDPENQEWIPELDGMLGVWALSGTIEVEIPNTPYDPMREKRIWVQLTWQVEPGAQQPEPIIEVIATLPSIPGVPAIGTPVVDTPVGIGSWIHTTYEVILPENPEMETILISGDIYVDELVIDTYCVPEPTSALLATMGLIAVIGGSIRRRKR